jgi:hypothetical protein
LGKTGFQLHAPWQQLVEVTEAEGRGGIAPVSRFCINVSGLTAPPIKPDNLRAERQETKQQRSIVGPEHGLYVLSRWPVQ